MSKTLSSAFFMFFATLFSTVALGAIIEKKTGNHMGISEYLAMNALAGMLHALFGAQPLLVLRPTGPITAITGKLYDTALQLNADFHEFLLATGTWVALLMGVVAALAWSRHITRLTPFTHDIFACFVCSIYVTDGITDVITRCDSSSLSAFGASLFSANLAAFTFALSLSLSGARSWSLFPPTVRVVLADYAVTIAVVATIAASYAFGETISQSVHRIGLPQSFGPTCFRSAADTDGVCMREQDAPMGAARRSWLVGLPSEPHVWLAALAAALPVTFFFYMDQNISSLLCQLPEMRLERGRYFHAPFLFMAVFNGGGPLFGLPFVTGSLPHSPQFVRSLAINAGNGSEMQVAESRVAPLLMYALVGLPLLAPSLLGHIPEAAIDGILTFVGYEGIVSTGLWHRVLLVLTPREHFPPSLENQSAARMHLFTALQLAMLGLCWIVNLSPYGLCVAFVIVALVPLRELALPLLFSSMELEAFDGDEGVRSGGAIEVEMDEEAEELVPIEEELPLASGSASTLPNGGGLD